MRACSLLVILASWLLLGGCSGPADDDTQADDDDTQADDDDTQADDDDTQAGDDDTGSDDDDTSPTDADGDGWDETTDCNDANPDVHPEAVQLCDGTMDNDCDAKLGRTATQTLTC